MLMHANENRTSLDEKVLSNRIYCTEHTEEIQCQEPEESLILVFEENVALGRPLPVVLLLGLAGTQIPWKYHITSPGTLYKQKGLNKSERMHFIKTLGELIK